MTEGKEIWRGPIDQFCHLSYNDIEGCTELFDSCDDCTREDWIAVVLIPKPKDDDK